MEQRLLLLLVFFRLHHYFLWLFVMLSLLRANASPYPKWRAEKHLKLRKKDESKRNFLPLSLTPIDLVKNFCWQTTPFFISSSMTRCMTNNTHTLKNSPNKKRFILWQTFAFCRLFSKLICNLFFGILRMLQMLSFFLLECCQVLIGLQEFSTSTAVIHLADLPF